MPQIGDTRRHKLRMQATSVSVHAVQEEMIESGRPPLRRDSAIARRADDEGVFW